MNADKPAAPAPATTPAPAGTGNGNGYAFKPIWNWLTVTGLYIALTGLLVAIFLFLLETQGSHSNVYLAILTFGVTPVVVFSGVGMAVAGVWHELRRRRRNVAEYRPQIDLAKPRHRQFFIAGIVVALVVLTFSVYSAFRSMEFVEGRQFCGEVCHQVMHPEYIAHTNSPHSKLDCVECHTGPGLRYHIRDKLRGLHQIYAITTQNFARPIVTPLTHLRPAREICEQCHWPQKFYGKNLREFVYFLSDKDNTRFETEMLVRVGGGAVEQRGETGSGTGIHWHMLVSNKMYFIATDAKKQDIPYVKTVDNQGRETVYLREGEKLSESELLAKYPLQEVDCVSCHNRSVHQFNPPDKLLNGAMLTGRVDPSLPFIKKKGLEVLAGTYQTQQEGVNHINSQLRAFYQKDYPELWSSKQKTIISSIDAICELYRLNFFPEMLVNWKTHPDNIGHTFSAGCFRCHSGKHVSQDGAVIKRDCNSCHEFVLQGTTAEKPTMSDPQEFKHPADIEDMWKESDCTDCHTGAGTGN